MRKKKAAALPGAIALCSILLIISITVSGTIVTMVSENKINRMKLDYETEFLVAHEKFVADRGETDIGTLLGDTSFRPRVYTLAGHPNIKSLVAWKKNIDEIKYYSIVNFDVDEDETYKIDVLAYQTTNLYIYEDEDNWYVGGIVPISKEAEV